MAACYAKTSDFEKKKKKKRDKLRHVGELMSRCMKNKLAKKKKKRKPINKDSGWKPLAPEIWYITEST